ncbi:hypothetical protein Tco_0444973 [Tanacetum coccineum]
MWLTFDFGLTYDKPIEDDQEKSKVVDESDSTIPDLSHQAVTSTPLVIAPVTDFSSPKPSSLVTPPPINTQATTINTSLPEITPFIALQLKVARLEQEMSKVKKIDHSANSIKNQESEKSPKEIIKIKREQGEEKKKSTYSIRSTDKVALEEFNLKSALFKHMNKNKTANRNPANYHLYHALMEALIADEDAMDKEVKDRVKNHKKKNDSDDDEDDDDDEGPSAGSNQGKSEKRRRHDSGASGSAQPPTKDDEQSLKKPRKSDASTSKQHPALTSTGWQITDTRDDVFDSLMHRSDPESEHSEQSSDEIPMQDEGHVSDLEDTDNAHIPKVSTTTWFKPIPEGERPATPEPEWSIPPNDFPEPENNWANTYSTTYQVPAKNKLQRKMYDIGSFIKWFCRRTGKKKFPSNITRGKRCEKNYSSVRRYVADPVNAYPKRSITKLILKGAVIFDVVSYQFRCALNYSKLVRCGARMLNKLQESIPNRSSRMLYRMLKLPVMVDVAQGSRLGAWLRACCLFILSSKSRGVFRSNSTLVLKFSFP